MILGSSKLHLNKLPLCLTNKIVNIKFSYDQKISSVDISYFINFWLLFFLVLKAKKASI